MVYKYKTIYGRLLKALRNSATYKIKHKWSRECGSGFIAEDVREVKEINTGFKIRFKWGEQFFETTKELNLRETEELIKFLDGKE